MRFKSFVLLALAMGCGLVAAIGVSQFMDARNRGPGGGERQAVFIAMADINPNEELTAQNIKLEEWPKAIVPAGALTKLEEVEGKRCRMKVYAGEPILSSKLFGADESIGAAKDIPPGYRVAHVLVDGASGSNNLILPGDRVDVLVGRNTASSDMRATASKIVLQDIKVFAVDTQTENEFTKTKADQTEPITAKTISLLVLPRQAEILHAATGLGGTVRLVLRNPDDDTHFTSQGATVGDVFGPDERSNRKAETGEEQTADAGELTDWLKGQQDTQAAAAPQLEPAAPSLPKPLGPRGKMIVIYGNEVMQVDFPGDGGLPTNPMIQSSAAPGMGPRSPLGGGTAPGGDAPEQTDDANQDSSDEWNDGSSDGDQPTEDSGKQDSNES